MVVNNLKVEGRNNQPSEGLVLKNYSGFYYVQTSDLSVYECKIRGKVKERIVSGDRVLITPLEHGKGILERVFPRQNELYRPKVANVSLVLIVMAHDKPKPSLMLLDRLLFLAEYSNISPCIVLNKSDLRGGPEIEDILQYYPAHFRVIKTSSQSKQGIDDLKEAIKGQIAVFAGPSGVGKSTLLNHLVPDLEVQTQEVSHKIGRGKHTTRHVELFPLTHGGWIVDTPGFSVLDMPPVKREELSRYFPDFLIYADYCRFRDCLHYKEQDCGVRKAVEEKRILASRHENYVAMLEEIMENERCY